MGKLSRRQLNTDAAKGQSHQADWHQVNSKVAAQQPTLKPDFFITQRKF